MNFKNSFGLTLIELVVATTILLLIFSVLMSTFANFTSSKRKLLLENELHNEAVFLLERIAREIHNGTIDYQGYWRESLLNKTADYWKDEGINPSGVLSDGDSTSPSSPGFNMLKNCNNPSIWDSAEETETLEKQKNILFNYRYQFIFPGSTRTTVPEDNGNDYYPTLQNIVHLNCLKDNYNQDDGYNAYDDEPAYGSGPRAFAEDNNTSTTLFEYSSSSNSAQSSKIFWDWDLSTINPQINSNPPLLLIKKLSSPKNGITHERTALRLENNKVKLIRFLGEDSDTTPPDFIPDTWNCDKDFGCGPVGNRLYNGNYIWSQKEQKKNTAGNENTGQDNGIGTITDTDLEWKDITPEKIEITKFDFILSPVKDPHRAFFEKDKIQKPQVTLILEAQAKYSSMKGIKGNPPKIRIQTTVTPRVWDLIEADN